MYAQPEFTIEIKNFVITNTGSVNITTPIELHGEVLDNDGMLDIDYRRWPVNVAEGNENSNIYMTKSVEVSGNLKAGSLYIETGEMTVSGSLDVSGGGYISDTGPGIFIVVKIVTFFLVFSTQGAHYNQGNPNFILSS